MGYCISKSGRRVGGHLLQRGSECLIPGHSQPVIMSREVKEEKEMREYFLLIRIPADYFHTKLDITKHKNSVVVRIEGSPLLSALDQPLKLPYKDYDRSELRL